MTRSVRFGTALLGALLLPAVFATAQPAFEARTDRALSGLGNPVALAVGDFVNSGDGILDVAVTWDREDALTILENNGDGTFSLSVRLDAPPSPGMGGPPESVSNIGVNPAAVVAIDLDGDTIRDDLAGVNQDTNRFFAYENGGGTWTAADPEATRGGGLSAAVGSWYSTVLPEDNCDDLFSATQNGAVNIAVSRCDGSGEFEIVARFFRAGEVSVQTDIEVGDFVELGADAGQPDLLTLDNLLQNIVIWPGDPLLDINLIVDDGMGNSRLVFKPVVAGGNPASPVQSLAEDWDGDGRLDLLVLTEQGYALWYQGTGDPATGGFADPIETDLAAPLAAGGRQPTRLTAMDYADVVGADGRSAPDGIRDLIVADAGQATGSEEGFNWLWIVPGTGPVPPAMGPPSFDPSVPVQYHHAAPDLGVLKPGSLAAADFVGGGDAADVLLLGFDSSNYTLFENGGVGDFNAALSFAAGSTAVRGLAPRSLAGQPDAVVYAGRGLQGIGAVTADGAGRLVEPGALADSAALSLADEVKVLELDGDATPDALATFRDEHVLYRGMPDGSFAMPEVLADGPNGLSGSSRVGDLGDGGTGTTADLAIFDPSLGNSTLGIWLGDGNGGFTLDQEIDRIYGYSAHATGNFIAASTRDTVVVAGEIEQFASPPQLYVVTADATGAYSVTATVGFPPPFDMFPAPVKLLISADFDANGFDDLVAVLGGGETFYFSSNGSALSSGGSFFTVGSSPRVGLAEDLDGDLLPELIVANRATVAVLANSGGAFGSPLVLPSNIDNAGLAALDLDGDGLAELVVGSERTSDLTVFRNVSTPPFVMRAGPDPTGTACRYSWPAVDSAVFSFVRGNLSLIWDDRTMPLSSATETPCAVTAGAVQFFDDAGPLPAPAPGWPASAFYLVRCEGANCPDGSFGADSFGMARYANDPPDPCP